jgi:hypothetical protein
VPRYVRVVVQSFLASVVRVFPELREFSIERRTSTGELRWLSADLVLNQLN